jgi:GT2 family glycosyltransferase
MKEHTPRLSVIIPTYRREEVLIETIHSLLACEYPREMWELVVVDQTAEHTATVQKELERLAAKKEIRWFHPPEINFAATTKARNWGITHADNPEFIIFTDDDVEVKPDFFERHLEVYTDPKVGAVAGRVIVPTHTYPPPPFITGKITWFGAFRDNFHADEILDVDNLIGCNFSLRASILQETGLFDEAFIGNAMREESDWAVRVREVGYVIRYIPQTSLLHKMSAAGGSRSAERLNWYYHLFFNNFLFYSKHTPSWRKPFFVLHMLRPLLVCWLYYGKGNPKHLTTALCAIRDGWAAGKASQFQPKKVVQRVF